VEQVLTMTRAPSLALLVLTGFALTTSACLGGSVRSATSAAVPVFVDETLSSFENPRNRERVEQILGSPEMQGAIQETARALVQGALEPGTDHHIESLTDSMADVLARDLRDRILPAVVAGMRDSLNSAFSQEDRRAMSRFMNAAVTEATAAAIRSAAVELPRTLAPAMRGALVDSLNAPDLRAAITSVSADATRSALLSSRDVIAQMHERDEGQGPVFQLVDRVQRMLERVVVVTFLLGALLGSFIVWASRHVRRGGGGPSGPGWRGPSGDHGPPAPRASDVEASGHGGPGRLDPSPARAS
jgi:hypothetical protein